MIDPADELLRHEIRVARRLVRLFRLERSGHFQRRPIETVRELIGRRGSLIDELTQLEDKRRSLAPWIPDELGRTMAALGQEVGRDEQRCLELLAEIGAKLSRLRGEGTATGLRGGTGGRLLGSG